MTRFEAEERARRIWGEDQVVRVKPSVGQNRSMPGWVEWWVDVGCGPRPRSHALDCNGHAVCHQECADCEVQVCP